MAWKELAAKRASTGWKVVQTCIRRTLFEIYKRRLGAKAAERIRDLRDMDCFGEGFLDLELRKQVPEWGALNISELFLLLGRNDGPGVMHFIIHKRSNLSEDVRNLRRRQREDKSSTATREGEDFIASPSASSLVIYCLFSYFYFLSC